MSARAIFLEEARERRRRFGSFIATLVILATLTHLGAVGFGWWLAKSYQCPVTAKGR